MQIARPAGSSQNRNDTANENKESAKIHNVATPNSAVNPQANKFENGPNHAAFPGETSEDSPEF
jgi:hypothetical protein